MRLIPVLTAILVSVSLYFVVFERDALLAFALGKDADAASQQAEAPSDDTGDATARPAGAGDKKTVAVVVQRSKASTIDSAVILRGQTLAARQVEVRAETSATVISDPLRKGVFVEKGDLLCKLDPGTREASLAEARARLSEAKSRVPEAKARLDEAMARLDEATINYTAAKKLQEEGYASETRLVSSQAGVRTAEAAIASAESGLEATQAGIEAAAAAVAAAKREIDRLTITAPFKGILESDTAELGSLMQPGSLCATVIQLDPIKLVGYVPETSVNRIKLGALAGARLIDGTELQGFVTFLSRSADPNTRTFLVEIEIANPDLSIRDGQTATIAISSDGAKAHKLPQSALTLNNDGQLGVRTVDADNIVRFAQVELLRDEADGVWLGGLPDEADVIVIGQDFVTAGVKVTPSYREVVQ